VRFLYQFVTTFWIWLQALKTFRKPALVLPFIGYGLLEIVLVLGLSSFYASPLDRFLPALLQRFFGDRVLHYPDIYVYLPQIFARSSIVLGVVVGPILLGAATKLFADHFVSAKFSLAEAMRLSFRKYPSLLVVSIVTTAAVLGASELGRIVASDFVGRVVPNWRLVAMVRFAISIAAEVIFVFAVAFIVLKNEGLLKGMLLSIRKSVRSPIAAFLLVAVPVLLYYPVRMASSRSGMLVRRFNPEIVAAILIAGVVLTIFTNYVLVGGVTRYFLIEEEE